MKNIIFLLATFLVITSSKAQFITTWRTTTVDESITIPTTDTGYNYTVNWGDGTPTTNEIGDATHTYSTAGVYTVMITVTFPRIYFNNTGDKTNILSVDYRGANPWTSLLTIGELTHEILWKCFFWLH